MIPSLGEPDLAALIVISEVLQSTRSASPMNIHTVQISLDLPDEISPSVHTGCSRDPDEADSSIRTDNLQGEVDPECSNLQHEVDPSLRPESSSLQREIDPSLRTESSITLQDEVDQTSPFEQYTLQDLSTNELSEDTRTSEGHDVTSDGEGDVEIESMCEDGSELDPIQPIQQSSQDSPQTVTFDVRRRTLINVWQRATLEEYYRGGMWSAALQLHHMHVAAAEKTGLDLTVVKVCERCSLNRVSVWSMSQSVQIELRVCYVSHFLNQLTIRRQKSASCV